MKDSDSLALVARLTMLKMSWKTPSMAPYRAVSNSPFTVSHSSSSNSLLTQPSTSARVVSS